MAFPNENATIKRRGSLLEGIDLARDIFIFLSLYRVANINYRSLDQISSKIEVYLFE